MPFTRILLTSVCVAGFAVASQAGPVTLNVKPGLWQMTSSGEAHGAPPIPADALARLSPAQRAQVQAMMARSVAHVAKPHVFKSCVTEKELRQGFDPSEHSSGERCQSTVLSSSATMMDVRVSCVGERRGEHSSGHFHFTASSPVVMNGTIDMTMSDGAHTMRIKRVMQGQWLAADCGKYAHNIH